MRCYDFHGASKFIRHVKGTILQYEESRLGGGIKESKLDHIELISPAPENAEIANFEYEYGINLQSTDAASGILE
ncbi:unnamed protein product [Lupinus luteus]|uniref:Uncharacterized protein n=1 Tax=Lupinus luteus TaxID=3873 RepID=A0AAV1XJU6_LUPLU